MMELLLNAENALALGLLDSAERTYRTVLEADPRNGIAAVGLSRVALERGDEAGAVALAQAALEIDSENATARRMIDRLDEVARFRAAAAAAAAATPATAEQEASTDRQRPGGAVTPVEAAAAPAAAAAAPAAAAPAAAAATPDPNDTPNRLLPARPGLLWRILRRS
jgi:tetratricopeptide (TPR) repeat protein